LSNWAVWQLRNLKTIARYLDFSITQLLEFLYV